MKFVAIILFLFMASHPLAAQKMVYKGFPSLVWPKLYDIIFVKAKDDRGEYEKPVFSNSVRSLKDKEVVLPGYMVPLENQMSSDRIMLSSLPLNACFFCGVGGPETVVEIHLKKKTTYIEEPIEVKGTLRLNETNPDEMIYVLEDAEIIGTVGL